MLPLFSKPGENPKRIGELILSLDSFTLSSPGRDELSIYRAKKCWKQILKERMMLEENHDFRIIVVPAEEARTLYLSCNFLTSFGRYAFWRLVSMQAPDTFDRLNQSVLTHNVGMLPLNNNPDCAIRNPQRPMLISVQSPIHPKASNRNNSYEAKKGPKSFISRILHLLRKR